MRLVSELTKGSCLDRETIAFVLIIIMALAVTGVVAFQWYHSYDRSYRRRQRKEHAAHDKLMASKNKREGD